MREQELRKVVEEVVKALAQKGLLQEDRGTAPAGGTRNPAVTPPTRPIATTIGTAGKVFSSEWSLGGPSFRPGPDVPVGHPAGKAGSAVQPGGRASRPALGKALPAGGALPKDEDDEEGCSGCRRCGGKSGPGECPLQASGADRFGVCRPTQQCSKVARMVDHTLLKANATQEEVASLCEEARSYCFASVCVNPSYVPFASQLLRGSGVKVCTVIGFPLGSTTSTVKAIEARDAIANGAEEIDMVVNVGALKSGNDAAVFSDIRAVREATRGRVLKVILETALLSREEKVRACLLSKKAGADFVKTSTGFSTGGATVEDVRLMRETVGPAMGVKASGGIRDAKAAQAMIEAGATRLGTSASVAIVTGEAGGAPSGERRATGASGDDAPRRGGKGY
ncbi:MAG: deoxyribose-phosphate aldolase [Elusimicrobia bacterium]|nr:deoxyribose-phosphate aldolase [Elusimicrobiota bacterium]